MLSVGECQEPGVDGSCCSLVPSIETSPGMGRKTGNTGHTMVKFLLMCVLAFQHPVCDRGIRSFDYNTKGKS